MITARLSRISPIETAYLIAALCFAFIIATQGIVVYIGIIVVSVLGVLAIQNPIVLVSTLLILAPLRTLIATEADFALPLDIGQLLFIALLGMWFIQRSTQKRQFIRSAHSPFFLPLIGFLAVSGLSAFYAPSFMDWLTEWLKWLVILALIFYVIDHRQSWEWIVFAVVTAGAAQAIIGLYTFLGGSGADHLAINDRFFRAFGTFGQPNPFGGFMGIVAPLSIMSMVGYTCRHLKLPDKNHLFVALYYFLTSALIVAALFASWSRGSWLGFIISTIVIIIILPRRNWERIATLIVITVAVGSIWFSDALPTAITDRLGNATQELFVIADVRGVHITTENYAVIERLAHWQSAINMGRENMWRGVGFGNYGATYDSYRLLNWDMSLAHAHNYYLNVFAETGIIGVSVYLILILTVLTTCWRTSTHPDTLTRCVVIGLMGTWIYIIVHSLTDNLYVNNVFIHVGVLLGLLTALHREVQGLER